MMWNNVHFRVSEDDIVEHCLSIKASNGSVIGYQVRNIPVDMKPFDNSYTGDLYQEVCINLGAGDLGALVGLGVGTQFFAAGGRMIAHRGEVSLEKIEIQNQGRRIQLVPVHETIPPSYRPDAPGGFSDGFKLARQADFSSAAVPF